MLIYNFIIALAMAGLGLATNFICSKAVKDRYKFEEDKTIFHSIFNDLNIAIIYSGIVIMSMVSGLITDSIFEIPNILFYTVVSYICGVIGFEFSKKIYKLFNHYLPKLIRTFNASVDMLISKITHFKISNIINLKSGSSQELLQLQAQVAKLSLELEERSKLIKT